MNEENWKPIAGYESRYDVSDHGRVRIVNYRGTGRYKIMRASCCSLGYPRVGLINHGRPKWDAHVHGLVAAAFIGPRPTGFHVNHKNAIKTDNTPVNLEYLTSGDNVRHALALGLMKIRGEENGHCKLTECKVAEIWKRSRAGESITELGREFSVTKQQISHIRDGREWKWLTSTLAA